MDIALALGWTGSFDHDSFVLRLATGDSTRAASVAFGPAPESRGDGLLDRATGHLETEIHRRGRKKWQGSRGRVTVGGRALVETRAAGTGEVVNGIATGLRRSHRSGEITLGGRNYRVRHRSRWRAVVEVDGQQIAVLTRRVFSRRNVPLDRTPVPCVQTTAVTEPDQLAVVLAASVMGPPGRTGFWGELGGKFVPWLP